MSDQTRLRKGPLSRFSALDLTRLRAGPTAVRQLSDWGCDVLKIESPDALGVSDGLGDARNGPDFQNLHRNKRAITLNLKDPEGVAIFKKLADKTDVILENFRPDVKHRLGIDYETLSQTNPRLIYASVSAFGQDGPYAKRPGYDQIVQGMGGLMSITGLPGQGPVRAGIAVADSSAGLYCALGVLVALLEREESGRGQWVQASLLEAMIGMLDFQAARWLVNQEIPGQAGNDHPTSVPTGVFKTKDGHVNIAGASSQEMWRRLCIAMKAEHLLAIPDYSTAPLRSKNRVPLNQALESIMVTKTSQEWIDIFETASVACGPIYKMNEVFNDPQTKHLGIAIPISHPELGDIELVGQPVSLSRTPAVIDLPTPDRSAHTKEVLRDLGYSDDQIKDLHERLVV